MNKNDSNKEILSGIYAQISAFDNKANIAISILGIAFALFVAFLNFDKLDAMDSKLKLMFYIVFGLLIAFTIFSILSFIMVIRPRKRKLYKDKLYPNYYRDIVKMNKNENLLKKAVKRVER